MNHKWRNRILKKYHFLDTGTYYSKRPFTNHCYVGVIVTSYSISSRTVLRHTEHKKQLLYFLERHRISYHHGYGHRTALIWIQWTITCGVYWSSECIAHAFVTSVPSRRLVEEWQKFDQKIIDLVISQWRLRLRSCIQQEGGHFEHRLWNRRQQNCSLTIDYLQC